MSKFFFSPDKDMFIDLTERGKERDRERNIDVKEIHRSVASHVCHNWGSNPQPIMYPARESNLKLFGAWDNAPTK